MNRRLVIPASLREIQSTASDPLASAWASANAGSGKTHVLTQRVLRLLLGGTPPSQILGLTFTKAAAANMATRIFAILAQWTSLDDEALAAALAETGARETGPEKLKFARQLFARTVETPGGLKIQTLHAFCERLLQLFPFEANVPAHFKVIDEREAEAVLEEARNRAIASMAHASAPLERVARDAGAFGFNALIQEALGFAETFDAFDDAREFAAALRTGLGLTQGETRERIEAEMLGGDIGRMRRRAWAQGLDAGKPKDCELATKLRAVDSESAAEDRIEALLGAFFIENGDPRGGKNSHIATDILCEKFPGLEADLRREQDRLIALRDLRRAAQTVERSVALFSVAKAIVTAFATIKGDRGELDFSDQIARALRLVTRSSAAWVMHKLDARLDHLLIDEAQDTSPDQWRILAALSAEFFAGAGARMVHRTIFAVGDEKQSIFSFQGAEPEKFAEMKHWFEKRCREAGRRFETVPLNFSFRSAPAILAAVDKVFGSEAAWRGVAAAGEPPPAHQAVHSDMNGVVELWPTIVPAPGTDPEDWRMPLDELSHDEPAAALARRIAATVGKWISPDSCERIIDDSSGLPRRIRPGDVMILVRRRNAFFEAMIRALKDRNVKAAGADRLLLRDHLAVMDLVAAGKAALAPDDDLTLASVLKSPLIELNEDGLFELAAKRRGSLVAALSDSVDQRAGEAARMLATWRARVRALSPYAFYARLLGEDGGRRALLGRLGPDAADPIDEFLALALAHEQRRAPSMHLFLAEVEATDTAIKRDMEGESEGARVLTVHASKGLEAPIVFLPDTCGAPDGRHDPKLLRLAAPTLGDPPLFAWNRNKGDDCGALSIARTRRREAAAAEHRRLLYVAMTRAAQRLIVAGYETFNRRADGCWYDLIELGLRDSMTDAAAPWSHADRIRRFGEGLRGDDGGQTPQPRAVAPPPAWLSAKAVSEPSAAPFAPSRTGRARESERVAEGRLAHALLQMLPDVAPERRAAAAKAYLDARGGALDAAACVALAALVVKAIEAPELAALFGPGSRGEVPLAGVLRRPGRAPAPYRGRLDRLLVTQDSLSIVDFKLGRAPTPPSAVHAAQLAVYGAALQPLYPELRLRAALVYLDGPTVRPIEGDELEAALDATHAS